MKQGLTHAGIELTAYQAQYSYNGSMGYLATPAEGTTEHILNTFGNKWGTDEQINKFGNITHSSQITEPWLRSMTEKSIGDKRMYPQN